MSKERAMMVRATVRAIRDVCRHDPMGGRLRGVIEDGGFDDELLDECSAALAGDAWSPPFGADQSDAELACLALLRRLSIVERRQAVDLAWGRRRGLRSSDRFRGNADRDGSPRPDGVETDGGPFGAEIGTYRAIREHLRRNYVGQYVVIKGKNYGAYKNCIEAFAAGRFTFGGGPMLVIYVGDDAEG